MTKYTVVVVFAALGLAGCSDDRPSVRENVGVAEQPLGEDACATVEGYPYGGTSDNGATEAVDDEPNCGITFQGLSSTDASYTNTGCSHQFIAEFTGTSGRVLQPYAGWYTPPTEAQCPDAKVAMTAWRQKNDGSWVKPGGTGGSHGHQGTADYAEWQGTWVDTDGGPDHCEWVCTNANADVDCENWDFNGTAEQNAVRVAVSALLVGTGHRRVTGGVSYGPGPCGP